MVGLRGVPYIAKRRQKMREQADIRRRSLVRPLRPSKHMLITAAAAAVVGFAVVDRPARAAVAVTSTAATATGGWVGTPAITMAPLDATTSAFHVAEDLNNGRVVAQTFTPTQAMTLSQVSVFSSGGA